MAYINITPKNISSEHLCCAIADKKHQCGVAAKKQWLSERIKEGHVFRKLDEKGKVFIEYAPLETAFVPIDGQNYLYIYCLWVSGSFKGKGHGRALLEYCIADAKANGKAGICVLTSGKKTPFLSDKKFFMKFGFEVVDAVGEYELLALPFSDGATPVIRQNARQQTTDSLNLVIYYSMQCPYIPNCIEQVRQYCSMHGISHELIAVDSLDKAKNVPCVFNNWAVFHNGKFVSLHLLNETYLKKLLTKS